MATVSFVVPAFNEEESLPHLREALGPIAQQYADWEVIVVDDGSTDRTAAIVEEWRRSESRVSCIRQRRNRGKSAALMAGFAAATKDIVVTLDADLQDDPQEIPKMVELIVGGTWDGVGGWKQNRKDPLVKVISSKVFNGLANTITKTHFHDLNCGLKAYRREVVQTLDLYGDLYRFIPILAIAQGWRMTEVPVVHHERQWGISKYGLRLSGAFDLITLMLIARYRWRPLHFFGRWGVLFLLIGLAILVYLSIVHFLGQAIAERPLLIFGVLFVVTGVQFIFTGLLGDLILQSRAKRS